LLRDGITNVSEHEGEILVNTDSKVSNDRVARLLGSLGRRPIWWDTTLRSISEVSGILGERLRGLIVISSLLKVNVVGEMVVQLRVNDSLNEGPGVLSEFLQNLNDYVLNDGSQRGESQEDFVDDI